MTPADISLFDFVLWAVVAGCFTALLLYDLFVFLLDWIPDFLQVLALFVVSVWRRKKS